MFFVRLGLFTFFLVCYELIWSSTSFSTGNNGKRESTQKPLLRPRVWGSPAEGRHPCYRSNLRPWRVMVFVDERWRGNQPQFGSYSRVNTISYTLRIVHIRALPKQITSMLLQLNFLTHHFWMQLSKGVNLFVNLLLTFSICFSRLTYSVLPEIT